jgi:hypothetical protein
MMTRMMMDIAMEAFDFSWVNCGLDAEIYVVVYKIRMGCMRDKTHQTAEGSPPGRNDVRFGNVTMSNGNQYSKVNRNSLSNNYQLHTNTNNLRVHLKLWVPSSLVDLHGQGVHLVYQIALDYYRLSIRVLIPKKIHARV